MKLSELSPIPFEKSIYLPPYESPLEDLFAYNLDKYVAAQAKISKQKEVQTFCGDFRLDFVATSANGRSVGIECDGTEFHDESRDEWRDAMILGSIGLSAIYRFQGPALFYHMEDCLYVLSQWEPHIFSERGRINLKILASDTARKAGESLYFTGELLRYPPRDSSGPFFTRITRNVIEAPKDCHSFLKTILTYGKRSGLTNLDDIIARYRSGVGLEEVRAEYFQD
jgi:hypothetical protein